VSLFDAFKDPDLCRSLLRRLEQCLAGKSLRFMEVCGTHTVAIFQSGLHSLLPEGVVHISGPGCPVCVTHESEVACYLAMAERKDVIVATFGDLLRVPGPKGRTLKAAKAAGARVEIVYSPMDALKLAAANPGDKVVFLGIGFETTAPTIAATVKMAEAQGLANFLVLSFHKLVPPALAALVADGEAKVEAFLLPGHVSTILGMEPYQFLARDYHVPSVIAGFDPLDILEGLLALAMQRNEGRAEVENHYRRAVADEGNPKARQIMYQVFQPADALWRGLGCIPGSGLVFNPAYARFDAKAVLDLVVPEATPIPGCQCGGVLKGLIRPDECKLFKKACTPANPVGPCMVSTEGSCAAYYKYQLES